MRVTAESLVKQIKDAANDKPSKPIKIGSYEVLTKLESKLVKMAKKDPSAVAGLVDLIRELKEENLLQLDGNSGPLPWSDSNAINGMLNSVVSVLNADEANSDDRKPSVLMR